MLRSLIPGAIVVLVLVLATLAAVSWGDSSADKPEPAATTNIGDTVFNGCAYSDCLILPS